MAAGDGLRKSPLQQNLRDQGLGVDVDALAEQHEAGEGENRGCDEAIHWYRSSRHCEEQRDEAIQLSVSRRQSWIASRSLSSGARSRDPVARNDGGYEASARGPGRRPRALSRRRWGRTPPFIRR